MKNYECGNRSIHAFWGRGVVIVIMAVCLSVFAITGAGAYEDYNSKKDYCGPKIEGVPDPIPSNFGVFNFNHACYEHDKCYATCATTCSSKSMCDKAWLAEMDRVCKGANRAVRSNCMKTKNTYYSAVLALGDRAYHCGTPACPDSTATMPMGAPNADKAFFFEHENFAGASVEWSKGADVSDLTKWNTPTGAKWNDRISSIKVGSGVRVLIYEHTNFKGRCMTLSSGREYPYLTGQNANLSGKEHWSDRISSLKVTDTSQRCP